MTNTAEDFDDKSEFPLTKEMSNNRKRECIRSLAYDLLMYSIPDAVGGEPTVSPERAFTIAEEFYQEAERRGY